MPFRRRPVPLAAALVLAALADCSKAPPPSPRDAPPASVSSLASALRLDASVLEQPVDPLPPPGDLRADIDRFTTLDACVAERAALDPLVGDALHAIAYETFLRDACRMLDAAKAGDAARCATIDATPLRARCEMLVAVLAGDADLCPWVVPARPAFGRDPTCIAVATRDPRLCGGAERFDRPTCEALAKRDATRCDQVISEMERAICRREVARLGPILPAPEEPKTPPPNTWGKLELHGLPDTPDPEQTSLDILDEVTRGVVLVEQLDGVHFDLGTHRESYVSTFGTPLVGRPSLGLSVVVPRGAGQETKLEHCELGIPGAPTLLGPAARCTVQVKLDELERKRGGVLHVHIDGEIGSSPRGYAVHAELVTFVRDFVTRATLATLLSPPRADAGAGR